MGAQGDARAAVEPTCGANSSPPAPSATSISTPESAASIDGGWAKHTQKTEDGHPSSALFCLRERFWEAVEGKKISTGDGSSKKVTAARSG